MSGLDTGANGQQQNDRCHYQQCCQQLRNPNVADHQAVGTQAFNEGATQTIPGQIEQEDLAVKPAAFAVPVKETEAQQTPNGFIQEAGMYQAIGVNGLSGHMGRIAEIADDPVTGHTPGKIGVGTEGFSVDKVTPAADTLANEEAHSCQVHHGQYLDLAKTCYQCTSKKSTDNAAINGHAALPGLEDQGEVVLVVLPAEGHKVETGTNDAADDAGQHHVHHLVADDAESLAVSEGHPHSQQDAKPDKGAVPGHLKVADGEDDRIQIEFQSQIGEAYSMQEKHHLNK